MATPTGTISLGDVQDEIGDTGSISMGDDAVRALAEDLSGAISMSQLRGKSAIPDPSWNSISVSGPSPVVGITSVEKMPSSGTVSLSFGTQSGTGILTYEFYVNSVGQGVTSSISVDTGDNVYIRFSMTGPVDSYVERTITITGPGWSDSFMVSLQRIS